MANRRSGDCEGLLRGPFCLAGAHEKCGHFHGFGIRPDPLRLRIEAFTNLCRCDCHSSCPVTNEQNSASPQAWRQSCTCPGAEAERVRHDELGIQPPDFGDFGEMRAKSRQDRQSRREAFKAAQASTTGSNREQLKNLYIAELRARGLEIPSEELLDAEIDAYMGNYLTGARLAGRAVVNLGKLLGSSRHHR